MTWVKKGFVKKVKVSATMSVHRSILKPAEGWTDQNKLSPQTCSPQTVFQAPGRIEGFGLLMGNKFVHYANVNEYKT